MYPPDSPQDVNFSVIVDTVDKATKGRAWLRHLLRPRDVALSGTWRLTKVVLVATPALTSRCTEWHVATWAFRIAPQGRP
jgi:hypothetical protein